MRTLFFRGGLVVGLVLSAVGPGCSRAEPNKPDVGKVGGTVLVYEVPKGADGKPGRPIAEWVTTIRRRIDPADVGPYTVRAAGATGFEVAIPRTGARKADEESVKEVKLLLTDGPDTGPPLGLRLALEKAVEPKK